MMPSTQQGENDNLLIIRMPTTGEKYLVTIAIGKQYLQNWTAISLPSWKVYCEKYDLGLMVFKGELINSSHKSWKKPTWQKLLIGTQLKSRGFARGTICYLDSDIIISPYALNIFRYHTGKSFGLVSKRKNLPYDLDRTLKAVAYNRKRFYSENYPLDSALFISIENLYKFHNLRPQADEACMGLIIFDLEKHSTKMEHWFHLYDKSVSSITNGGDQTHLNYHIQSDEIPEWLPYSFQALWTYEMAAYYPFLYRPDFSRDPATILACVEATLYRNSFLHFAGSWPESEVWRLTPRLFGSEPNNYTNDLINYLNVPVSGDPLGMIKPTSTILKPAKNDT